MQDIVGVWCGSYSLAHSQVEHTSIMNNFMVKIESIAMYYSLDKNTCFSDMNLSEAAGILMNRLRTLLQEYQIHLNI